MKFRTTLLELILLAIVTRHCQTYQSYSIVEDSQYKVPIKVKKVKIIKIELSSTIISLLTSGEKSFFWEGSAKESVRITLSASAKPTQDEHQISVEGGEGRNFFSVFNKNRMKELFETIEGQKEMYLRVERPEIRENEPQEIDAEISFVLARFFPAKIGVEYEFDAYKSKNVSVMLKFSPGFNNPNQLLKMYSLGETFEGMMQGYGKFQTSLKEIEQLPSSTDHDFNFLQYNDDTFGHVIDSMEDNAKTKCFSNVQGCYIVLNLTFETMREITFGAYEVDAQETIYNQRLVVDHVPAVPIGSSTPSVREYIYEADFTKDFEVSVIPVEGDVYLYVNPGFYTKVHSKAMYQLSTSANKRIIITKEEFKEMGLSNKNIYISVSTFQRASFLIYAKSIEDKVFDILPGMSESGKIHGGETRAHKMEIPMQKSDTHEFNVRLHLITGDANLYMKVCPSTGTCSLTKEELTQQPSLTLKKSTEKMGIKTVQLDATCSGPEAPFMKPGFAPSETCIFGIFVVGVNKEGKGKVHYELSVEDSIDSHLMVKNHFLKVNISIDENHTKYYHYNFRTLLGSNGKIEIHSMIDVHFGKVEYCLKTVETQAQKNMKDCLFSGVIDGNNHGLSTNLRNIVIGENIGAKSGKYYLGIKALNHAGLSIGFLEKDQTQRSHPGSYVMRNLKAGVLVNDRMYDLTSVRLYTFELSLPQNVEAISVSLVAKRGKFTLALTNNGNKPSFARDMSRVEWQTQDDHLSIDKDDPAFKASGRYIIGVVPAFIDGEENLIVSPENPLEYSIKFTYSDKHSLLNPGIPEIGVLHSDRQCFVIETHAVYENILITKTQISSSLSMYVNVGGDNYKPDADTHTHYASPHVFSVYVSKEELQSHRNQTKNLHVYICLYGQVKEKYELVYTYNMHPILALPAKTIYSQLPVANKYTKFIFHPDATKEMTYVDFTSRYSSLLEAFVTCKDQNQEKDTTLSITKIPFEITFPDEKTFQKKFDHEHQSLIYFTKEELSKYKNPVCLLSVKSLSGPKYINQFVNADPNENYYMAAEFSVQFSHDIQEIQIGSEIDGEIMAGQTKYYRFYNNDASLPLNVELRTLDSGWLMYYIARGKNERPSLQKNLKTGWSSMYGGSLKLDPAFVKERKFKDMRGYYVIGFSNTANSFSSNQEPVKYALKVIVNENEPTYLMMNYQYEVSLTKGQVKHLFITGYFFDKEEKLSLIVDNGGKDLDIYLKENDCRTYAETSIDSVFPDKNKNERAEHIKADQGLQRFQLRVPQSNYGRIMLTLATESEFSQVKLLLHNSNALLHLSPGYSVEGIYDPKEDNLKTIVPYFFRSQKGYYLEVDVKPYDNPLMRNRIAHVQISSKKTWDESRDFEKHQKLLAVGFNWINVEKLQDEKTTNQNAGLMGGLFRFGFFNRFYANYNSNFALVKCEQKCSYRISIKSPNHFQNIAENSIRQSMLLPDSIADKFTFWTDGTKENVRLRIHIKSSTKYEQFSKDNNQSSVVYDHSLFVFTPEVAQKMISLDFTSSVKDAKTQQAAKPVQIKFKTSHMSEDTLYVDLGKMDAGIFHLTINPLKDYLINYYVSYSAGDEETLLPGNYVVGRVLTNFEWHKRHPKQSEDFQKKFEKMEMFSADMIDNIRKKFALENAYHGKTYKVYVSRPGELRIEFNRCLGNLIVKTWSEFDEISLAVERTFNEDYTNIETMNSFYNQQNGDETMRSPRYIIMAIPKPGNVFIQVRGPVQEQYVTDVDPLMRKDIAHNYFGIEVNHMDNVLIFDKIKPGKFGIDFSGKDPVLKFQAITIPTAQENPNIEKFHLIVKYYLVLSKDPFILSYYNSCSDMYISSFYPNSNKTLAKNIVQVQKIDSLAKFEDSEKWFKFQPKTQTRTVYYASVFADIKAKPVIQSETGESEIQGFYYSTTKRLHYKLIKFETSDFGWPIELLSAIVGLIAIFVLSMTLINRSCTKWVNNVSGFTKVRGDVQDVLEKNFQSLKKRDQDYFSDDYKSNLGESGYATEESNKGSKTKGQLNLSVEEVIEEKIKKNQKLFPLPPISKPQKEFELTSSSKVTEDEEKKGSEGNQARVQVSQNQFKGVNQVK